MSRQFSVIVLCPNGRREYLKMSSNCSFLQILEEACMKQNLNPGEYDLWHYNKSLDLSLPIRFASLPNNALLELQPAKYPRKDSMVTIALQLESGERIMKDFTPCSTLFDILKQCLQSNVNFEENGEPVCIYMRQQIIGEAIKTTTLRSLGLMQGTAIIRLLYRKPEQLENQAHISSPLNPTVNVVQSTNQPASSHIETVKIEPIFSGEQSSTSMDVDQSENIFSTSSENKSVSNNENTYSQKTVQKESNSQNEDMECELEVKPNIEDIDTSLNHNLSIKTDNDFKVKEIKNEVNFSDCKNEVSAIEYDLDIKEEPIDVGDIKYIGERHAVLYSLDDITDVKKADLPDEFFQLTINDVRYLMDEYKRERAQMENQPLLTKEQRDRQILQNLSHYSQTVIRIYFPERLVIQAVFMVTETIQTVCDFLKIYLENKDIDFYLYTTPPKKILAPTKNLLESMLVPASVVYFGCNVQLPSYLTRNLLNSKSDPRAAALAASESRKNSFSDQQLDLPSPIVKIESPLQNTSPPLNDRPDPSLPKAAKIPKWMQILAYQKLPKYPNG